MSCWAKPSLVPMLCSIIDWEQPAEAWHKCGGKSRGVAAGPSVNILPTGGGLSTVFVTAAQPVSGKGPGVEKASNSY